MRSNVNEINQLLAKAQKISKISKRFELVELDFGHADGILECNVGSVKDYFIDFGDHGEVTQWISEYQELASKGIKLELVIQSRTDKAIIGMLALDKLNTETALIRMWINPSFQNQGFAKEACKYFIDAYAELYPNKAIIYTANIKNTASVNLAKSLEFVFTRYFTDADGIDSIELIKTSNKSPSKPHPLFKYFGKYKETQETLEFEKDLRDQRKQSWERPIEL